MTTTTPAELAGLSRQVCRSPGRKVTGTGPERRASTEPAKASARANAQRIVDVNTFVSWVQAVAGERRVNPNASKAADGSYKPDPTALSGFLFARLRPEFRPAVQAWLAEKPLSNPDAAPTPFALPEYHLAEQQRADRLERRADHEAALARRDNQRSDNYVLTTVLFASVLFFAGVSSKLGSTRSRMLTMGLGVLVLLAGTGVLATFPTQI